MDPLGPLRVRAVYPQDALPRLSLSLPCVMSARRIALLITGANKWDVYQRARQVGPELAGSELDLPVRGVLHQSRAPVEVFWAP